MNNQGSFQPKNPIIPIRFGIRHNPPTIALVYKRIASDIKERMYYILLNNLINFNNAKLVSAKLFEEHPLFLDERTIEFSQVEKLVSVLLRYHEENRDDRDNFNTPFPDMMSPIQTLNSTKNPYSIQDTTKELAFQEKNQSLRGILDRMASTHSFDEENNTPYKENSRQFENRPYNKNNNPVNQYQAAVPHSNFLGNQKQNEMFTENTNQYMNIDDSNQQGNSQQEPKNQRGRNKNEKNRITLAQAEPDEYNHNVITGAEILDISNNQQQEEQQNYFNSHYNYGQRHGGHSVQNLGNAGEEDQQYGGNEFVDQMNYDQEGYNEDYHNVMEEEPNLLTSIKANPQKHIQIPSGLNGPNSSTFMSTPMKGYMDSQMNLNTPSQQDFGFRQYNGAAEDIGSDYAKPDQYKPSPPFQKRQSLALQESEPYRERGEKKRRGKFGILQDLASMHKDQNVYEDNQLEVI